MSKKVYIITRGDYSDYHICACFSTRKQAEERLHLYGDGDAEIEEWDLDKAIILPEGLIPWCVRMNKNDGEVFTARHVPLDEFEDRNYITEEKLRGHFWYDTFEIYVLAKDEKHAIKIANEKRTQGIALGLDVG